MQTRNSIGGDSPAFMSVIRGYYGDIRCFFAFGLLLSKDVTTQFLFSMIIFGSIKESDSKEEFLFESNYYRIVVEKRFKGREKQWVLTAFDLRKKPRK